jgi:hypothetical protein
VRIHRIGRIDAWLATCAQLRSSPLVGASISADLLAIVSLGEVDEVTVVVRLVLLRPRVGYLVKLLFEEQPSTGSGLQSCFVY